MVRTPGSSSVERAFAILEFLNSSKRGWNISEISRSLGLPKSSTHVLTSTLSDLGYIRKYQARRFQLSPKMYGLGRRTLSATPLPEVALAPMHWAVQRTKLTAHVGILEKSQVVFVQKVDGPSIIKFDTYLGKCSEIHCTGLGKALLAFQPENVMASTLDGYTFNRFTKNTLASKSAFLEELAHVKKVGYALDNEEEELGIRCLAVPVLCASGVSAAVSFTGTTTQVRMDKLGTLVTVAKIAAARIAAQL